MLFRSFVAAPAAPRLGLLRGRVGLLGLRAQTFLLWRVPVPCPSVDRIWVTRPLVGAPLESQPGLLYQLHPDRVVAFLRS